MKAIRAKWGSSWERGEGKWKGVGKIKKEEGNRKNYRGGGLKEERGGRRQRE